MKTIILGYFFSRLYTSAVGIEEDVDGGLVHVDLRGDIMRLFQARLDPALPATDGDSAPDLNLWIFV